jgi:uncharacterized protein
MADLLNVQVCYAAPLRALMRDITVEEGTTIEQAIVQSGILNDVPGIDLATQPVGLYGKKRALDTVLREHDRIEIYRALVADPKSARRRRSNKSAPAADNA